MSKIFVSTMLNFGECFYTERHYGKYNDTSKTAPIPSKSELIYLIT
jgi:hypothetical protein